MPNCLLALKYQSQDCLVHLYYTSGKIVVNILDENLRQSLRTDSFALGSGAELLSERAEAGINQKSLKEFYDLMLEQHGNLIRTKLALPVQN